MANDGQWFTDADQLGTSEGLGDRSGSKMAQALALVRQFRQRRAPEYWPHVIRARLADGLEARIRNPDSMYQAGTNLCGVVSIVRPWAYDFPVEYAQFAIDLFERGRGQIVGAAKHRPRLVTPSKELTNSAVPQNMDQADWITLSSVRESLNRVFNYTSGEGIFAIKAWTLPSDVVREFQWLGYTRIKENTNFAAAKGYSNLLEASTLYERGYRVLLLINSNLLSGERAGVISFSNHWVALDSAIVPTANKKAFHKFVIWSWGRKYDVPTAGNTMALEAVIENYHGYVAGLF